MDDEPQIRKMLRIALKSEGYDVVEASDGESALAIIVRHQPAMVILDLSLGEEDGISVLEELRSWSKIPVVILSVRGSDREKVRALDRGAQDYVTKPFSVEELLARIRANLRDHAVVPPRVVLDDGHLRIDFAKRMVEVSGSRVDLTPKEYGVLSNLALVPNRVVTQTQLLRALWGPSHVHDTHYLRIVVSRLRRKLGDNPTEPNYLITEPGVGYRLLFPEVRIASTSDFT